MHGVIAALGDVAEGTVLFHNGLWGGPEGFIWADADGEPAGRVPQWESEALMVAERRGLVAINPRPGSHHAPVTVTPAGLAVLATS